VARASIRRMLTLEDHRLLAERCVRLAKASSKPNVAQYLMALAANYLELAEFAGKVRRPEDVVQHTHASREEKTPDGEPRLDATI
jgi:hypothetical protein